MATGNRVTEALMRLDLQGEDLPQIKSELKDYHPGVKTTHRVEAMARGLGYKTYASLLAALEHGAQSIETNDAAFNQALSLLSGQSIDGRTLSRSLARVAVRRAQAVEPSLTERGFDSAMPTTSDERRMSFAERRQAFEARRAETLKHWAMDQFELALLYLDMQERRRTINRDYTSYNLKHRAEDLSRNQKLHTHLGNYVSNGMLIAAAITRGFEYKQVSYDSLNAYFNISSKTIHATWPERNAA